MKTKLEMAHDYLRDIVSNWEYDDSFDPVAEAWKYADAMQAEADKREKEQQSDHVFEAIDEWQPDWSQAPDGYGYWVATADHDGKISRGWFYDVKPEFGESKGVSIYYSSNSNSILTDSFGYTGDWRNSLRKRPK